MGIINTHSIVKNHHEIHKKIHKSWFNYRIYVMARPQDLCCKDMDFLNELNYEVVIRLDYWESLKFANGYW